jgi:hypothetical protein
MTRLKSPVGIVFAAVLTLLGASPLALAETGATGSVPRDRPLDSSDEAQREAITKRLNAEGVTDVEITPEKHGWQGHGMRNGKRVKIEVNDQGQWEVKESRH